MNEIDSLIKRAERYLKSAEIKLAQWQIERIDKAKRGIREGNYLTNAKADKIAAEWLNK